MILLQICLLPFSILLLLGAIFMIGSAGLELVGNSARFDQNDAWIDERLSAVTTDSVPLPCYSQSFNVSSEEQVNPIQTEIVHGHSIHEFLSELPIYII